MEEKDTDSNKNNSDADLKADGDNKDKNDEGTSEGKNDDDFDRGDAGVSNIGSDILSDEYLDYDSSDYGSLGDEPVSDDDENKKNSDNDEKGAENDVSHIHRKSRVDASSRHGSEDESGAQSKRSNKDKPNELDDQAKRKKTVRGSNLEVGGRNRSQTSGRNRSQTGHSSTSTHFSKGQGKPQNLDVKSSMHKRGSKALPAPKNSEPSGAEFLKKMEEKRKELQNVKTDELLRKLLSKELKMVEERSLAHPEPNNRPDNQQQQLWTSALPPKVERPKKAEEEMELSKIQKDPGLLKKELEVLNVKMGELSELIYMKEVELEQAHVELFETHGESNIESTFEEDAIKRQLEDLRDLLREFEKKENEQNVVNEELSERRAELDATREEIKRLEEARAIFLEEQRKIESNSDYSSSSNVLAEYRETRMQRERLENSYIKTIESLNQRLEEKALIKEDLNGKLLQRAELVAQREDLEEIHNELQLKYKEDLRFNIETNKLELGIKSLELQIAESSNQRRELLNKQESLMEEIEQLREEVPRVKDAFQNSLKEKNELVMIHNTEFQNFEVFINSKTKELGLPEIQELFVKIGKTFGETLEREVLVKQLNFIEEEEQKMVERFDKKFDGLQAKLAEAFAQQNEEMVADVKEQMELLHGRTALRKDAISKWKSEVGSILNGHESQALLETFNKDKFLEFFSLIAREKNITAEQEKLFQNALSLYIQTLEQHDSMIKEKDAELRELDNLMRNLEEKQGKLAGELSKIDSEIKRIESNRIKDTKNLQELHLEVNQRENLLEQQIAKEAEQAFGEYLHQQQAHFENIIRTYGTKAANKLKQDNYKQFLEIMRKNHKTKWEKFKKVEADGIYYDKVIAYNIKFVDEVVVPNLKRTMGLITELKEQVKKAKKEESAIEEKERSLEIHAKNLETQIKLRAIGNLQMRFQNVDFLRIDDSIAKRQQGVIQLADEVDELEHQLHEAQFNFNKDEIVGNIEKLNMRLAEIDDLKLHLGELKSIWDKKEEEIELLKQELNQLNNKKNYFAKNLFAPQSASKQKSNVFQTALDSDNHPNRSTAFFGSSGKKNGRDEQQKSSYSNNKEEPKRSYAQQQYPANAQQARPKYIAQGGQAYHVPSSNERPRSAPRSVYNAVLHQSYNAAGYENSSANKFGRRQDELEDDGQFEKTIRMRPQDGNISFRKEEAQFNENMIRNKPIQDVLKMVDIGLPNPTKRLASRTASNPRPRTNESLQVPPTNVFANNNYSNNQPFSSNQYQINQPYDELLMTKGPLTQQLQSIFPNMREKPQGLNYLNLSEKKKYYYGPSASSSDQQQYMRSSQDQRTVQKPQYSEEVREASSSNFASKALFNVKINFDKCSEKEFGFLESIRALLEGAVLYKRFSTNPNAKQQVFNPLKFGEFPPEYCGFSQRIVGLHRNLNRFEFRNSMKPGIDLAINLEEIMRAVVPQLTTDIVKLQKKLCAGGPLNESEILEELRTIVDANIVLQSHINSSPKLKLQDLKNVSFYPFYLILERGGRVELIAQDYQTLKDWVNGINVLIKNRKILPRMKGRLEINSLN